VGTIRLTDLDKVADELYSLAPADFTGARDSLVAGAREAGDKQLAAAIGRLRRPTAGAWLANLLARSRPTDIAQLSEVGAALRQAQQELSGQQLRELTAVRRRTVRALVTQADELARAAGHPAGAAARQQLEDTLNAALAEPDVAAELRAGRLTAAVSYSGFGASGVAEAAVRRQPKPSPRRHSGALEPEPEPEPGPDPAVLTRARQQAKQAEQEREQAAAEAADTHQQIAEATATVERLRTELADTEKRLALARSAAQQADRALRTAERAVMRASEALRRAEHT
jgi:hypothetical protein